MIFTVIQKLIDRTIKLFVSICSTKKYFTTFYIQSLALYEQKKQEQNIPTWSLSFKGWLGCDKIPW